MVNIIYLSIVPYYGMNVLSVKKNATNHPCGILIDRIYRLGQTRPVKVFRFVIEGTIEDRVMELQGVYFYNTNIIATLKNGDSDCFT